MERCPGWQRTSCGKVPGEGSNKYWQHHCNPLAVPSNSTGIRLTCAPERSPDNGKFQCYFSQVGLVAVPPPASRSRTALHVAKSNGLTPCHTGRQHHLSPDLCC